MVSKVTFYVDSRGDTLDNTAKVERITQHPQHQQHQEGHSTQERERHDDHYNYHYDYNTTHHQDAGGAAVEEDHADTKDQVTSGKFSKSSSTTPSAAEGHHEQHEVQSPCGMRPSKPVQITMMSPSSKMGLKNEEYKDREVACHVEPKAGMNGEPHAVKHKKIIVRNSDASLNKTTHDDCRGGGRRQEYQHSTSSSQKETPASVPAGNDKIHSPPKNSSYIISSDEARKNKARASSQSCVDKRHQRQQGGPSSCSLHHQQQYTASMYPPPSQAMWYKDHFHEPSYYSAYGVNVRRDETPLCYDELNKDGADPRPSTKGTQKNHNFDDNGDENTTSERSNTCHTTKQPNHQQTAEQKNNDSKESKQKEKKCNRCYHRPLAGYGEWNDEDACPKCICYSPEHIKGIIDTYKSTRQRQITRYYKEVAKEKDLPKNNPSIFSQHKNGPFLPLINLLPGYHHISQSEEHLEAMLKHGSSFGLVYPLPTKLNCCVEDLLEKPSVHQRNWNKWASLEVRRLARLESQHEMLDDGAAGCQNDSLLSMKRKQQLLVDKINNFVAAGQLSKKRRKTADLDEFGLDHDGIDRINAIKKKYERKGCCSVCRQFYAIGGVLVDVKSNRSEAHMRDHMSAKYKHFKMPKGYAMIEEEHVHAILENGRPFGVTFPIPTKLNPIVVAEMITSTNKGKNSKHQLNMLNKNITK